jgi:DNA processing protein
MSTRLFEIALSFLDDIGPVTARSLVSYCGGVEAVFRESKQQLLKIPGVGEHRSKLANRDHALALAEKELELIEKFNLKTFFYLDEDYPHRLKSYQDSPILLYGKGTLNFNTDRLLAVVGTRKQTDYGRMKCEQIIEELRAAGVTIVSGLAYGIDAISHKASVKNRMPTIGVLGNGLPEIYPKSHASLVRSMLEHEGGLISQFHCHTMPDRENFPMRNKTVAYMTDATLVIESKASGGSMITANFAFHNFKELFALPGRSIDVSSEGCNKLIKANMAQLVTHGDDILKAMSWDIPQRQKAIQSTLFLELSDDEKTLVDIIRETPDIHIDQISIKSQLPNSIMISLLLHLELQGLIKQTVGKRYIMGR